jgi:hypothetical protein
MEPSYYGQIVPTENSVLSFKTSTKPHVILLHGARPPDGVSGRQPDDDVLAIRQNQSLGRGLARFLELPLIHLHALFFFGIVVSLVSIGHFTSLRSSQKGHVTACGTSRALLYGPETVNVFLHLVQVMIFSIAASNSASRDRSGTVVCGIAK